MTRAPLALPPLSLYVHIPWCERKCPYCDFNSHQRSATLPEAAYIQRLLADLRASRHYFQDRLLHSIFIGGGTPSLFSAQSYTALLAGIRQELSFEPNIEITLEANPGTFEQQKFADYRNTGINRLSIGVQSFDDRQLKQLGRIHGSAEAKRAAAIARDAGFDNFNLDLMFALPAQSAADACLDLQTAIDCAPTHLSWYQLTIEPNTEFFSRPPQLPHDDAIAEIQQAGMALLANTGYERYEISAYSKEGQQALHNLNYWQFGDYLGIGAGAHGKITLPESGTIVRTRKTRMPAHYLDPQRVCTAETRVLEIKELPLEFMMNALRLCQGVPLPLFAQRTGIAPDLLEPTLARLRQRNLLVQDDKQVKPTDRGLLFLNDMLLEFL